MTDQQLPLLASRHTWRLDFGSGTAPVPRAHDTVRTNMALGMQAMELLLDTGIPVGPVRYCLTHRQAFVPVAPGTTHRWHAPHSDCTAHSMPHCPTDGYIRHCTCLWATQPGPRSAPTTPADELHEALNRTRARLRTARHR